MMNAAIDKPVIFLAFANDRQQEGNYLRKLGNEADRLRTRLRQASAICEVVERHSVTPDQILQIFQDYKGRVVIFHYAGHADDYTLLLENNRGERALTDARGLAEVLRQQQGLQLVFLNACSTRVQANELHAAGVPVVIATSRAIDDELAADFADAFYQSLATGDTVDSAFANAKGAMRFKHGDLTRHLRPVSDPNQEHLAQELPWAIYQRNDAESNLAWNLPQAANDPLWDLPALPTLDLPASPYRDLQWFHRTHAPIFFGRGHEIRGLYQRITAPDGPPLALFYGQSGVGKSSVLAAGLLPRLEQSHAIAYVRRDQAQGLLHTLLQGLNQVAPQPTPTVTYVDHWRAIEQQQNKPLLIVLDQVEEYFTRPAADPQQEMQEFLAALGELFGNPTQRPRGKLLLSFRKEWLAEIEKRLTETQVPQAKVFLERLDRRSIMEVIIGPTRSQRLMQQYGLIVEEGLPELIADDLLADSGAPVAPILQIILTKLWTHSRDSQLWAQANYDRPVFNRALYDHLRLAGFDLDKFLHEQLTTLQQEQPAVVESGLVLDLLAFHTTPLGTAEERTPNELQSTYLAHEAILPNLVRRLEELYLLVDPAQNNPTTLPGSRLAHDTLASSVRALFDKSNAPGQRARRILETRVVDWRAPAVGAPLDEIDLQIVERGRSGMREFQPDEQRLLEASQAARQKRKQAQRFRRGAAIGALLLIVLGTAASEQLTNILLSSTQIKEATALAFQANSQLTTDPKQAVNLIASALPITTSRPYVAQAEFAYTEALQQDWEETHIAPNSFLVTQNQLTTTAQYLALGSDTLSLVTFPALQPITLTVSGQYFLGIAWHGNTTLLSYDATQVRLWREIEPGKFGEIPLPKAFSAEQGALTCAEWHPSGNQLAICQGKSLWRWQLTSDTPEKIHEFPADIAGDADQRRSRWSPTGQWLAAWDMGRALLFWQTQDGARTLKENAHTQRIRDAAWSDDGQHLVTVADDGTAKVWSVAGLEATVTLSLTSNAPALNQRFERVGVKFVDNQHFLTWGFDNLVRSWAVTGEELPPYPARRGLVFNVEIKQETQQLLALMDNGDAHLWDRATAQKIATFSGHTQPILAVAWQGDYLATASMDGTARVWNAHTGGELSQLLGHQKSIQNNRSDLLGVYWLDAQHLATVGMDGTVRRWRFVTDRDPYCGEWVNPQPATCYGLSHIIKAHDESIKTAQWVNDTTLVSVDYSGNIRLWAAGQPAQAVAGPPMEGRQVELNPDGQSLLVYDSQTAGQLWDLATVKPVATIAEPITATHWLEHDLLINHPAASPVIIAASTGQTMTILADPGAHYTAAHLSRNQLATVDTNQQVRIWSMPAGSLRWQWPTSQQEAITHLVWLPQGNKLLLATNAVTLTLHNAQSGQRLWTADRAFAGIKQITLSPDEQWIAVASGQAFFVLSVDTGKTLWQKEDPTYTISGAQWVTRPEWSPLNPYRALGHTLYSLFAEDPLQAASARLLLMTWGGDGMVHFWQWDSHKKVLQEVLRLREALMPGGRARYPINLAALRPDQARLLTVGDSGELHLWQLWLNQPKTLLGVLAARRQLETNSLP